jgi:protease I
MEIRFVQSLQFRCLAILTLLFFSFLGGCVKTESVYEGGETMNLSGKKILMIVAPKNFRDEELLEPKKVLEGAKANVTIASKGVKTATGILGAKVNVDLDISEVDISKYDAIIFVGGTGASVYFNDSTAHAIASEAYSSGKIIGAICIAPSTLANAGLLKDKNATAWPSEQENIEAKGGHYTGELVTVDDRIITAKGPMAATAFGKKIAEALK